MNPQETKELMEMIRWIRDKFSLSILLIEHDMGLVMGVCERIYVLEYGFCIASGTLMKSKIINALSKLLGRGGVLMLKVDNIDVYYGAIHAIKALVSRYRKVRS